MERRPTKPPQKPCPPPLVRNSRGRCVPPASRMTPLGGPAGGLWPSGGGQSQPAAPLPCLTADILAECFALCSGVISQGAPGPVCDWTYFTSLSGPASTVTFSPGSMTFDCPTSNEAPAASKPISMSGVNDRTVQFTFQEFDDLQASISYLITLMDAGSVNLLNINLGANGDVVVSVGPVANVSFYLGNWAPNKGRHIVHLTVDGGGLPRLWIDAVEIPLAFLGSGPFGGGYPDESVTANFSDLNNDAIPRTAVLENLFIAAGQFPPSRTFCCP